MVKNKIYLKQKTLALSFLFVFFLSGCSATISETASTKSEATLTPEPIIAPTTIPNSTATPAPIADLYKVVKVVDGDTMDVDINGTVERLRLIGIDTPETVHPSKPVECFGKEASNKAKEVLSGKMVSLEADTGTQGERDKYGRLLRFVYLEDGTFFNKMMISEGYAHEYTYQSIPYKYQTEFKEAEKQAREGKKGLWNEEACNGEEEIEDETGGNIDSNEGVVKKSNTGICHAPNTTYYEKTKNFTPYKTIDDCLNSGGRLPKK